MSSNRNSVSTRRVRSIRRQLASKIVGTKIAVCLWHDLLLLIVAIVVWLATIEYGATGSVDLSNRYRTIQGGEDVSKLSVRIARSNKSPYEKLCALNGILEYKVVDKNSGEILVNRDIFTGGALILTSVTAWFVLQVFVSLLGIPAANAKVRRILRPLDELAMKADELARFDFSEDKYQLIEDTISNLEPNEETRISLGDSDLAGIENAMNSLIARIRQSNQQQARFVNDASHELRTPIAVIQGYANMLSRWGREDEQVLDESITAIKNESDNMKHLVEQLLFLARGDAGRTAINKDRVNVNNLMKEVYEESLMIDENHVYKFTCPDEEINVYADEGLLKQAVRILVDNAAKYTRPKDEISLSVGKKDNKAFLQVQDAGIGMKEADVEHMFERFYRADEARSYNGTGLGLSIAKWIVDKHDGHFEIISREELGTRIGIYIDTN